MTKRWASALVGLFFLLTLVSAVAIGSRTIKSVAGLSRASDPGWRASAFDRRVRLVHIREDGPAAGKLQVRDILIEINGLELKSPFQAAAFFEHMRPGSTYTVLAERDGRRFELVLETEAIPRTLVALLPLATIILPAIFLLTGLAVFLLRPEEKSALLLALMFGCAGSLFISGSYSGFPVWLGGILVLASLGASFFWPIFFHFFLVFPDESLSPVLKRLPRFEYLLYLPHLLINLPYVVVWDWMRMRSEEEAIHLAGQYGWIGLAVIGLRVLYIIGGLVSLLANYRGANKLLRRKMRVIVAGSLGACLPMTLLIAGELLLPDRTLSEGILLWMALASFSAFLLFPISFVYAIARHQVIPVRLILRRGVRYLFVARGSIALELIAVGLVLTVLLDTLFDWFATRRVWVAVISGLVAIAVWQATRYLHHRVIAPMIDRRFFRQAYNAQQILSDLGQALRGAAELNEPALVRICETIRKALNADTVTLFLRDESKLQFRCTVLSQHLGAENLVLTGAESLSLPNESFVIRWFSGTTRPLRVDFSDPHSWARALVTAESMKFPEREGSSEVLKQIRAALLLPIASKDELLGVLALGPRLGDLPYSREDEHLLMAVAWQLGYAIENDHLVRRKAEEQRLRREIEFATEVQKRLFPQSLPSCYSLDLAGVCHPARGIGGDYYDFLQLGDGRIGIAVADVSGKGLSAALLMSTVQASLRTQTSMAGGRIIDLVASMNRLLCESTDTSHYATFFYAEYEESTQTLVYVNAGHNPPLLVRAGADMSAGGRPMRTTAAAGTTLLLETGGPVIGLLSDCSYECERIEIRPGDILLAYTDGVSEASNPEDEEFGEQRMVEIVLSSAYLPAAEIGRRIVAAVRDWCRDAPQHDDLTLVIVKAR
ncbi:MAG: SpoIIE family protein phosphatase [Acidobacteria bacterium]|nr:SpoIIE family protein phosphatase [Acidobacteriota bacterium]MCW5967292.1 SpoIIE family protein phosphatase [Blastocatellales bacterium]